MPKKIRIFAFSVAAVLVLGTLFLFGVGFYISNNADEYKGYLTELIAEHTGMRVNFGGAFSVSVFPWIGFEAEDVSIENPEQFKPLAENLLSVGKLGIELKLIPLIRGDIEVGDVRIDALRLELLKDDGIGNWMFRGASNADSAVAAEESKENEAVIVEEKTQQSRKWSIGSVMLADSSINYTDVRSAKSYGISNISLNTGRLEVGEDIELDFAAAIDIPSPKLNGNLSLHGRFNFLDAGNFEIFQISGKFISSGGLLQQNEAGVELSANVAEDRLDVRQCVLTLADSKVVLSGKGNFAQQSFSGPLNVQSDVRQLLNMFGIVPDFAAPNALRDFSLNAQLSSGADNTIKLSDLIIKLDSTNINGDLLFMGGSSPVVSGGLVIDAVNLDSYLPAPEEAGKSASGESAAGVEEKNVDLENGRNDNGKHEYNPPDLGLAVNLSLGQLDVKGMQFRNLKTRLLGEKAVYSLDPLSMDFASAAWNCRVIADLRRETPDMRLVVNAKQIAIEQMLKVLTGKEQMDGRADLSADLRGKGLKAKALLGSLGGSLKVSAKGSLKDFKLPRINLTADSKIKSVEGIDAKVNNFSASFVGAAGVFNNSDMIFDTSLGRGKGSGTVNIGAGSLNYLVTVETRSANLPVRISGPFSDLSYTLDAGAMLSDPENLRKGAEKLLNKDSNGKENRSLEEKIDREIKRGLGKLFGK